MKSDLVALVAGLPLLLACPFIGLEAPETPIACAGMYSTCSSEVATAALGVGAMAGRLGMDWSLRSGSHPVRITELGANEVAFVDDGDVTHVFRWPDALPAGFVVGEAAVLDVDWRWQVLRSNDFGIAALVVEQYGLDPSAAELPGGGPTIRFEEDCYAGQGRAVALAASFFGEEVRVSSGSTAAIGEWTIFNRGGLLETDWYDGNPHDPDRGDDDWDPDDDGESGDEGEDGDAPDPACERAAGMAAPITFRMAATVVWRPAEPIEWCEQGLVHDAQAALQESRFYGTTFVGTASRDGASGTIDRVLHDTVYVSLADRGEARFTWPEAIPAGFEPGDAVELIERDGWDEMHGSSRLAVWVEADFVASYAIPPAFDAVELGWAERCSFPDRNVGGMCGMASGTAALHGLVLPDGDILDAGRTAQVGDVGITLHGAVQLPSYGSDNCIVEAWFEGVVTATAPAEVE